MRYIFVGTVVFFIFSVAIVYFSCFLIEKKRNKNVYSVIYQTPSQKIIDAVGGDNNSLPLNEFVDFIEECANYTYSVAGDFNE